MVFKYVLYTFCSEIHIANASNYEYARNNFRKNT